MVIKYFEYSAIYPFMIEVTRKIVISNYFHFFAKFVAAIKHSYYYSNYNEKIIWQLS